MSSAAVAVLETRQESTDLQVSDHESRLRRLERWAWVIMAVNGGSAITDLAALLLP